MGIYEELGISFDELGCVMLDVDTPQFKKTQAMAALEEQGDMESGSPYYAPVRINRGKPDMAAVH